MFHYAAPICPIEELDNTGTLENILNWFCWRYNNIVISQLDVYSYRFIVPDMSFVYYKSMIKVISIEPEQHWGLGRPRI